MGQLVSALWRLWSSATEKKIVMVGLDAAGKSTILYKLALGETVNTQPTVGSNVESFRYKNVALEVWDLGGQSGLRPFWASYYKGTDGVILVADSSDRARLGVAKGELWGLQAHEDLRGVPLLVLANKSDVKNAMTPAEISAGLALPSIREHDWAIQSCCALTGEGLDKGLDWLSQRIVRTSGGGAPAAVPQRQQQQQQRTAAGATPPPRQAPTAAAGSSQAAAAAGAGAGAAG